MLKSAVILSGCGFLDGSEIHESVLCLLSLSQKNINYQCFAPNENQTRVVNHFDNKESEQIRNVLQESARISRSVIEPLESLVPESFDLLILPGGFGVALNLSDFATKGHDCTINPFLEKIVLNFHEFKKPIVATCISPAILGVIFKKKDISLKLSLGNSPALNKPLDAMGHQSCLAQGDQVIYDDKNLIFSTPCYMEDNSLAVIAKGIDLAITQAKNSFIH